MSVFIAATLAALITVIATRRFYEKKIVVLTAVHKAELEKTHHDSFGDGWDAGHERGRLSMHLEMITKNNSSTRY